MPINSPNVNDSDNEDFLKFCNSKIATKYISAETKLIQYLSLELISKVWDNNHLINFWQ